ncbi:MAG: anti-sigma factor domain-containing protein, partial [Clostridiaceae bacterium]|nr:anti-sigma factor domain-containing protein [Clostridiaceae bacterium]
MKAVVLDIEEKQAVLLNQDGMFVRVKNRNYEIGQTVELLPSTKRF